MAMVFARARRTIGFGSPDFEREALDFERDPFVVLASVVLSMFVPCSRPLAGLDPLRLRLLIVN